MKVQEFFELSTSSADPQKLGLSPFFEPREVRCDTSPPTVPEAMYHYIMCARRSLNFRMVGFADPSLSSCVEAFRTELRATAWVGDSESLDAVLLKRRGVVHTDKMPWKPRPAYTEWLKSQDRLP